MGQRDHLKWKGVAKRAMEDRMKKMRAAKAVVKKEREEREKIHGKELSKKDRLAEKERIKAEEEDRARVRKEMEEGDGKFQLENFPELFLGFTPYQWQRNVLKELNLKGSRVALKAANGSGKTSVIAASAILWHMLRFPGSLVISTAGVYRQVEDQLWPRMRRLVAGLGGAECGWDMYSNEVRFINGSRAIGFSTNDSGKFEGWHGQGDSENLLMVVDEAKTVPDSIFEAIERCQPSRLLVMSSPGGVSGGLYRAFTKEIDLWKTFTATAFDCPHISKVWVEEQELKWGPNHPLIRSMVHGEFMEVTGESLVLSHNVLQQCFVSPPEYEAGAKVAFCDFAAGGDENVFCMREGNEIKRLVCWRDKNTSQSIARFITEFKKEGLRQDDIYADSGGMGIPMCDVLRDAGYDVHRVNNGERAYNDDQFSNRGTEMWMNAARIIEKKEIRLMADDALFTQLTTRRLTSNHKGKLLVEPKSNMKDRGLSSPDRADAVVGAMVCGRAMFSERSGVASIYQRIKMQVDEDEACGEGHLAGSWCGA